jgi:hypothetical protein
MWRVNVGQGLRTGANKFFYAKFLKRDDINDFLITDKIFDSSIVPVSQKYSIPAFRYQSDVNEDFIIKQDELIHRLIFIPEDFYTENGELRDINNTPLETHIKKADIFRIEDGGHTIRFRDLSAVKPNIKIANGKYLRHWFMLPPLSKRHKPQLCIARVNYKSVKCNLIVSKNTVVDANFSTLWMDEIDERIVFAVFALLNSSWVKANLEASSTIMGGGALKVEATHLRNMILPIPSETLIAELCVYGRSIADSPPTESYRILTDIDRIVLKALLDTQEVNEQCIALRKYVKAKQSERSRLGGS